MPYDTCNFITHIRKFHVVIDDVLSTMPTTTLVPCLSPPPPTLTSPGPPARGSPARARDRRPGRSLRRGPPRRGRRRVSLKPPLPLVLILPLPLHLWRTLMLIIGIQSVVGITSACTHAYKVCSEGRIITVACSCLL